ncbi:MAG: hypothetical protein J4F46_00435 [Dehalococcoidia bacterium]|nr:hypothetical protein [Dehalococcoidia bacterium]
MPIRPSPKLLLPLAFGGLVATVVVVLVVVYILHAWWSTPIFGFGAGGPDQPIAFPHTVHVEDQGIQCEFCHRNVTKGDAATVPAVEQCLFCHKTVTGEDHPEIAKLLEYGGMDASGNMDPSVTPQPIDWERVHRVPDHVQFAHEPHIRYFTQSEDGKAQAVQRAIDNGIGLSNPPLPSEMVEASCTICHGKVRAMDKVKQERRLKMGDCVDCHRNYDAPTDCVTCHY